MKNWLVVANASRARLLEESDWPDVYAHVADLVHPQSRVKGAELATDRPGHVPGPVAHDTGSSAFDPRTAPLEREHTRFAHEVAMALDEGIASGRCAGVVLVASAPVPRSPEGAAEQSDRRNRSSIAFQTSNPAGYATPIGLGL